MTRPLRIGVQLPEVEYRYTWTQLRTMAETAEAIGLDSIWFGDHLMYRYDDPDQEGRGPFEAWSTLAALAAVTSRVQLGPLVASALFHSPAMIAKKAATIDQISDGRFVLGLGAGWNETEYRGYGFPFDHRFSRFAEAFDIIREMLDTGHGEFAGTYYRIEQADLHPPVANPAGVPLMIGSVGDKMLEHTLPHVAMWNAWSEDYGNSVEGLQSLLARIDATCERVGRDPATLEKTICPLVRMPGGSGRISQYGMPDPVDGADPARLASTLQAYADLGVGHVMLVLDPIAEETISLLQPMLEQFGMPAAGEER